MSEITEKFCEECGKNSPIEVKFCKFCGVEFPIIDHPDYIQTNFPQQQPSQQPLDPLYNPIPYQTEKQPQYQSPQQPNVPLRPPIYHQQVGQNISPRKPPRMWKGGGMNTAIKEFYSNPQESTAPLLEDPQAPSSFMIILLAAFTASLIAYFSTMKTNFVEIIDDDEGTLEPFVTSSGIKNLAMSSAVIAFAVVFISWWLLSWALGKLLRGGLQPDQYLLNAPTQSMRQLIGYLYFPTIVKNVISIILLQFESNRDAKISVSKVSSLSTPNIEYLTEFSSDYILIMLFIKIVSSLVTAIIFYRSTKYGLGHNGSAPMLIAILIVLVSLFLIN